MHERYNQHSPTYKRTQFTFLLSAKTDHGDFIEEKNNNVVKTAVLFIDGNFPGQKLLGKSHYFDDSWLRSWLCFFEEISIAERDCEEVGRCVDFRSTSTETWNVLFYVDWEFLEALSSRSPMDKSKSVEISFKLNFLQTQRRWFRLERLNTWRLSKQTLWRE